MSVLTRAEPRPYVGDSNTPEAARTRTLQKETDHVLRSRVVNPGWISAMQRVHVELEVDLEDRNGG